MSASASYCASALEKYVKQYYTQEGGSYDSEVEQVVAGVEFGSADIAHDCKVYQQQKW